MVYRRLPINRNQPHFVSRVELKNELNANLAHPLMGVRNISPCARQLFPFCELTALLILHVALRLNIDSPR